MESKTNLLVFLFQILINIWFSKCVFCLFIWEIRCVCVCVCELTLSINILAFITWSMYDIQGCLTWPLNYELGSHPSARCLCECKTLSHLAVLLHYNNKPTIWENVTFLLCIEFWRFQKEHVCVIQPIRTLGYTNNHLPQSCQFFLPILPAFLAL